MLDELKIIALLRGVRGEPSVDFPILAEAISRFAQLAVDCPDLTEMELNPPRGQPDGRSSRWMRAQRSPAPQPAHPLPDAPLRRRRLRRPCPIEPVRSRGKPANAPS